MVWHKKIGWLQGASGAVGDAREVNRIKSQTIFYGSWCAIWCYDRKNGKSSDNNCQRLDYSCWCNWDQHLIKSKKRNKQDCNYYVLGMLLHIKIKCIWYMQIIAETFFVLRAHSRPLVDVCRGHEKIKQNKKKMCGSTCATRIFSFHKIELICIQNDWHLSF